MKKRITRSMLKYLLLFIMAAVIGVVVFSFNAERLAGNPLPMPFGHGVAVVLSNSMKPGIAAGDVIIVRETEDFEVGDVIVYQSGHSLVVHRVVSIDGDTVITKGDANNAEDTPFSRSAVKGVMVFRIPSLGFLVQTIKKPICVLLILAIALLLLERSYRIDRKAQECEIAALKEEIRRLQAEKEKREKPLIKRIIKARRRDTA